MYETNEMRGRLTLWLTDRDGRRIGEQRRANRIVATGRQLVAQLFAGVAAGAPPTKVGFMAVGTDPTAPADGQAGLVAEVSPRKPIAGVTYTTFTDTDGTQRVKVSLNALFDFGDANSAKPLREAGIFTANAAGTMYNRVTFDAVTKTNAFQLTLLWDVVF
jgi:hypothetical protein